MLTIIIMMIKIIIIIIIIMIIIKPNIIFLVKKSINKMSIDEQCKNIFVHLLHDSKCYQVWFAIMNRNLW